MIEVDLPDGSVAEFPDGTPPEVIKGALQKKFGAPQQAAPESQQSVDLRGELSAMTQNPARGQYEMLPEWQKPIVAGSDILSTFANGATMGFGDKAVAGVRSFATGNDYDSELAEQRRLTTGARNRAGWAGTTSEIAGAVGAPVALAGKGLTLAGRGGTAAMTGGKGLAARTGLMGAEGAGYGAATAAGNDQDIGTGAVLGAVGGVGGNLLGEGVSAGIGKVAGAFNKKPPVPTVSDLKAAGAAAFDRADKAGVVFNKPAVQQLQRNIIDDLTEVAFHPQNEPGAVAALNTLKRISQGNVTMKGLHAVRRMAQNGFIPGNNSNNTAIGKIVGRIDELIDAADPNTVLMAAKNPAAAAAAFKEGKKQWHTAMKLETVEKAITRGEQNAAAQVSGDVGRTTMGQLKRVLQSEAKTRGFTPAEMKQLGSAAGYSTGQRVAHAVGGLMPRGRLLSSIHGATALGTGGASIPLQAAGATVGFAAQKTADALAKKSVGELTRLIANGGIPPAQVQNVVQRLAHSKREALTRALMALGVWSGSQAVGQQ